MHHAPSLLWGGGSSSDNKIPQGPPLPLIRYSLVIVKQLDRITPALIPLFLSPELLPLLLAELANEP
jgi:hypothetical protein